MQRTIALNPYEFADNNTGKESEKVQGAEKSDDTFEQIYDNIDLIRSIQEKNEARYALKHREMTCDLPSDEESGPGYCPVDDEDQDKFPGNT